MVEKPDDETPLDDRIAHIRTLLGECSGLLDELDQALARVERVFPPVRHAQSLASFIGA